ncbi:MAG TPA: hypothetical protein VKB49_09475, partial [Candidatus Sulfotelmatobacter sp.]|nr:hypothetical protein [Candidatus Sulfotelmatobacter sp.]
RQSAVLREFLSACANGDTARLTSLVARDATLYSDGGGRVAAALNPILGADRVVRFLAGVMGKIPAVTVEFAEVNGGPGAVLFAAGRPFSVMSLDITEDGQIANLYFVTNPDKLPR